MLFSIGRSATQRLAPTAFATSRTHSVVFRATRKPYFGAPGIYLRSPQVIRAFASVGRTKKVSTSETVEKTATKKPVKKTTKKTTVKAKATAKPKAKGKAKGKAKAKAKAKPAPKKSGRKPVSAERKIILERRALKKVALFTEPKVLPVSVWTLYVVDQSAGKAADGESITNKMAGIVQGYKSLPPSEVQRLQSIADQNKVANAAAYKAWVESHQPQEIHDANAARRTLKRKFDIPKKQIKLIHDDRLPKRPATSFGLFTKARWASGDYTRDSGSVPESMVKIAQEWKNLKAAERQPFDDLAQVHAASYQKAADAVLDRKTRATKSPSL